MTSKLFVTGLAWVTFATCWLGVAAIALGW